MNSGKSTQLKVLKEGTLLNPSAARSWMSANKNAQKEPQSFNGTSTEAKTKFGSSSLSDYLLAPDHSFNFYLAYRT